MTLRGLTLRTTDAAKIRWELPALLLCVSGPVACASDDARTPHLQAAVTFPLEYSLTRPLLQKNPTALVAGNDWQVLQTDQDIYDLDIWWYPDRTNVADTRQVVLVQTDPTFGTVLKVFQTDADTILPGGTVIAKPTVEGGQSFSGVDKAWYRFTIKFQPGFTTAGQGGGNPAWKVMFGGNRHIVYFNATGYVAGFNQYGGTESTLPNSDYQGGAAWHSVTTEWSDNEWWEFIVYDERVSPMHHRKRIWMRELTSGGSIVSLPSAASWLRTFGFEAVDATVPAGFNGRIQLGINRNKPMFAGQSQHFFWGPGEVIDGSVLPDPYGIESQIR